MYIYDSTIMQYGHVNASLPYIGALRQELN